MNNNHTGARPSSLATLRQSEIQRDGSPGFIESILPEQKLDGMLGAQTHSSGFFNNLRPSMEFSQKERLENLAARENTFIDNPYQSSMINPNFTRDALNIEALSRHSATGRRSQTPMHVTTEGAGEAVTETDQTGAFSRAKKIAEPEISEVDLQVVDSQIS